MHNLVWVIITVSVGLLFGFLSGGLFSADYSSFWPAIGSIGTLGAWYFLYQQSKATNEQMRVANEQLQVAQIATYRTEIRHSIDRIVEYLMDGEDIRYDRLSWINASFEIDNISDLISRMSPESRSKETEKFGRFLDSKLPENLFECYDGGSSLLFDEMIKVHKKAKGKYERCNLEFAGRSYLETVYMFTRQYEFSKPQDIKGFRFRAGSFFSEKEPIKFKCHHCSNVL